jgi:hypothetical protein
MIPCSSLVILACSLLLTAPGTEALPASSYAGSTTTFAFPPANATVTATGTYFLDASQVGFAGPTPSTYITFARSFPLTQYPAGDEAAAIATAPAVAKVDSVFPLLRPNTSDSTTEAFDVSKHWGNLAPFSSVDPIIPGSSPQIPDGCEITQVFLLHRHGARYPTSRAEPPKFAADLHSVATGTGFNATGPLEFLNTWTYKLGAEILTPFGRNQL